MSGFDYLSAISRGEIPSAPIGATMGFDGLEVEAGRVTFRATPGEYHYNPIGVVHGGFLATLLDSCTGCAIHSTLPAGVGYTTLELKVNYLRSLTRDSGQVAAVGQVIHVGGRVATAEGRVVDDAGRLYGHATTTCMIFRP
jgi:uncharacterized protein (TIGR00369 family)